MPASKLVHSKLMRSLRHHFNCRATIQNAITDYNDFNEPITTWQDDPLLTQLPCYIEPASGGETRLAGNTIVTNQWNVVLAGFYPQINNEQQITVDSITYNITNASTEATDTLTALVVERVSI